VLIGTGRRRLPLELRAMLFSHVDLRVRDRVQATAFYDAILNLLGAAKFEGAKFTTWSVPDDADPERRPNEWFGIVEDPTMTPGPSRIAFLAPSRGTVDAIATYLPAIGARAVEMPHEAYGPSYYACFFEDPDGNKLEVFAER
jgi:catechol 2,3-dioxygenase-like lactoylglutathione lyase family enzyme